MTNPAEKKEELAGLAGLDLDRVFGSGPGLEGTGAPHAAAPVAWSGEADAPVGVSVDLASRELAGLYVDQCQYQRGVDMYRQLLKADPEDQGLRESLKDAETLARLLTLRGEEQENFEKGYRAGYRAGTTEAGRISSEEKIARLSAWLERIRKRT